MTHLDDHPEPLRFVLLPPAPKTRFERAKLFFHELAHVVGIVTLVAAVPLAFGALLFWLFHSP